MKILYKYKYMHIQELTISNLDIPAGSAARVLIRHGRISATDIVYLITICCFYFICFMGVDYTHMWSFVIYYSWSYEILLHVWIWRSENPVLQYCLYIDATWESCVSNQRPIFFLFNTISWLTTKETSNYLTGNVNFVINNSCTYEITHADVRVCRWRNRVLFCSIVFTVTLHDRASWRPKSPTAWQVAQQHVLAEKKRSIEAL